MNEKAQRMFQKLNFLKTSLRQVTRRPQVTMRDTVNLVRESLAAQAYQRTNSRMNNQASQPAQVSLSGGLPFLKGLRQSIRGSFQQQEAPQPSEEELEYQRQQEIAQQRVMDKRRKLAKLKKRKNFSVDGI